MNFRTSLRPPCLRFALSFSLWLPAQSLPAADVPPQPPQSNPVGALESFSDYIAFGFEHNPALKAAFERYRRARAAIGEARALPDPSISLTHFGREIETRTGPQEQRLRATQSFPWLGTLSARGDAAARRAEVALLAYKAEELRYINNLANVYFGQALLEKERRIARENEQLLEKLAAVVEEQVRGGAGTTALLRLEIEQGRVKDLRRALGHRQRRLDARLRALLGGGTPAAMNFTLPRLPASKPDIEQLREDLLASNPELARFEQLREASEADVQLARLERYPDFTVGVDYIRTGPARTAGVPGSGDDPWSVTVGVSIPLWGSKNDSRVQQALAARRQTGYQLRGHKLQLMAELLDAFERFNEACDRVALYRDELLPKSEQALEIMQTRYSSGEASLLDWIDSQRTLLAFEQTYWKAVAEANTQLVILNTLGGNKYDENN